MNRSFKGRLIDLAAALTLFLLLVSCNFSPSKIEAGDRMDQNIYSIKANTQLYVDDLGIGVAGIKNADYQDETGVTRNGLTAGLWIYDRSAEIEGEQFFLVHINQKLTAYGYDIQVLDIYEDEKGGVTLKVAQAE